MKKLLLIALIIRLFLQLVAGVAMAYLPFTPSYPHWDITLVNQGPQWLWFWGGFDGVHYLNIAEKGYEYGLTQAFFPVYPLLIKFFNYLVGNRLITALLISHLSFIGFVYFFVKLGRLDFPRKSVNWAGVLFLLFPASFFLFGVYTESLFLLLAAACFYFARRSQFLAAAGLAGLASATRLVGIFLLPVVLWEYYRANKNHRALTLGWYGLISGSGLLLYLNYLQRRFHDWLIFVHSQPGFGAGRQVNELVLPYQVVARYAKMFLSVSPVNAIYPVLVFEFLATLGFTGLIVYAFLKKLRSSYLLFIIPALLLPTLTGTFASMPRYGLIAFPLFYLLGDLKKKYLKIILAAGFGLTLVWALVRFSRGLWLA
ncbi:MAG: mannosyltransferase family protein [Patescibacteria group bacterium]|nr:mannosyltransferase family protein [Patescibacteria group bacterium]